jgi:hypothetical protein
MLDDSAAATDHPRNEPSVKEEPMSFLNRLRPRPAGRYPDGEAFKHAVMESYGFSDAARRILAETKFTVRNLHAPDGGGFWYGPEENRIELFGIQAEAAIHEMAHAWADLTGFYDEWSNEWDRWPTLNRTFRADVRRAAEAKDPRYSRICFIAGEYEFGNPQTGFAGMFENDSERFAGLASGAMADPMKMPPYIRRWYMQLFTGQITPLSGS